MLVTDADVKKEFARSLELRKKGDASTRLESFKGQIAQAISELMFTVMRDEQGNITAAELNGKPEEGKAYDVVSLSSPVSEEFTVATVASTANTEVKEDNPATANSGSENVVHAPIRKREA